MEFRPPLPTLSPDLVTGYKASAVMCQGHEVGTAGGALDTRE